MKKIIFIISFILIAGIGFAKAETMQKTVTVTDEVPSLIKEGDIDKVQVVKSFDKPTNETDKYTIEELTELIDRLTSSIAINTTEITRLEALNIVLNTELTKYEVWLALFPKE